VTILEDILASKRKEIAEKKKTRPLALLTKELDRRSPPRDFKKSLKGKKIQLIGEIKKASPIKGLLRDHFDPVELARAYERSGASALSVLTDEPFFQGSLSYVAQVKSAVKIPVLRKEFILDRYQIDESAAAGSDAILLIAALLSKKELTNFIGRSAELGMESLVEVHTEEDLEKAIACGAEVIGVNNRDLNTFKVDLAVSERLIKKMPKDKIAVSESGIHSREEVAHLEELGFHAVLIGEAFMKHPYLEQAVHEVMGW